MASGTGSGKIWIVAKSPTQVKDARDRSSWHSAAVWQLELRLPCSTKRSEAWLVATRGPPGAVWAIRFYTLASAAHWIPPLQPCGQMERGAPWRLHRCRIVRVVSGRGNAECPGFLGAIRLSHPERHKETSQWRYRLFLGNVAAPTSCCPLCELRDGLRVGKESNPKAD